MKIAFSILVLVSGVVGTAHGLPCFVESTNHGGGLISYTFRRGDDQAVWGLGTNFGEIYLQSFGVTDVREPSGWTHAVSASGRITWTVTNGIAFLDEPVTFYVQSCLTVSTNYSSDISMAGILSSVFELPDRTRILAGGYQVFDYIGPVPPRLTVERTDDEVVVRWPVEYQDFRLESCDRLDAPTTWTPVTNTPIVESSSFTVRLAPAGSARFFRLAAPCSQSP